MTLNAQQLMLIGIIFATAIAIWFAPSPISLWRKVASTATKSELPKTDPHLAALYGLDIAIRQLRSIGAVDEKTASNMTLFDAHERLRSSYLPFVGELKTMSQGATDGGTSNHKSA